MMINITPVITDGQNIGALTLNACGISTERIRKGANKLVVNRDGVCRQAWNGLCAIAIKQQNNSGHNIFGGSHKKLIVFHQIDDGWTQQLVLKIICTQSAPPITATIIYGMRKICRKIKFQLRSKFHVGWLN